LPSVPVAATADYTDLTDPITDLRPLRAHSCPSVPAAPAARLGCRMRRLQRIPLKHSLLFPLSDSFVSFVCFAGRENKS
jgi:hypothetical protein